MFVLTANRLKTLEIRYFRNCQQIDTVLRFPLNLALPVGKGGRFWRLVADAYYFFRVCGSSVSEAKLRPEAELNALKSPGAGTKKAKKADEAE